MADDDAIKRLEARLTRLEAALTQQPTAGGGGTGGTVGFPPGGVVVDPAPWPGGGWGHPRCWPYPWPWPWPHSIVDPGPFPQQIVDPAPFGGGGFAQFMPRTAATSASAFGRIGHVGDPPPIDLSRFSIAQLEGTLHSINAEKARLESLETLVKQQMEKTKATG
jgi:hypothetical protein